MHGDDAVPQRAAKERKSPPKTLGECIPGDIVVADIKGEAVTIRVSTKIWGTPLGRAKADTEFGWSELVCYDENIPVTKVVDWGYG